MSRKVVTLISIGVAIISIGLGVVIGYFSHPSTPEWISGVESFFADVDESRITSFIDQVQADNIRKNLMYFAEKPHMATSPRDEELANYIKEQWTAQLEEAYLTQYNVTHGFLSEDPNKPNKVEVVDQSGEVSFKARMTEVVYDEYMKDPDSIVPYFNAYGPPGDVQGKLIYANFGSDADYQKLLDLGVEINETIAIVKYGGGVGRRGKASNAVKYNVKGVLVFSDPANYVVEGEKGYPQDSSLPGTGVQRGSTLKNFGDPSTPNYPATSSAYRVPIEEIEEFPPIPLQPIGYDDAAALIRDLDGPPVPSEWDSGLDVLQLHVGAGFSSPNQSREVHLVTNNIYTTTRTYNVIGLIRGTEEPDKYVMYGNHRDSWVYGAVDPSSGTACMMEITRVFGEMRKKGWKPRRTILFASWGSEEFGLIGSNEWVEENLQLLQSRAVSYINVDIAVFANQSFFARASPLMTQVFYDVTKKIKDDSSKTLYEIWLENFPDSSNPIPYVGRLYTSSDYAPFYQLFGITSADISYRGNSKKDARYNISPYPTYHSAYDTFDYVDRFTDPGFLAHQAVARIAGSSMIWLSDSLIIPFSTNYLSDFIQSQISATETKFGSQMQAQGISLDALKAAGASFETAANSLQEYFNTLDRKDPKQINAANDRLLTVERCFIEPRGLPGEPYLRHVSGSPGSLDDSSGSFPGIQDAMFDISPGDIDHWNVVKQQLALVIYKIETATKILQVEPTI